MIRRAWMAVLGASVFAVGYSAAGLACLYNKARKVSR